MSLVGLVMPPLFYRQNTHRVFCSQVYLPATAVPSTTHTEFNSIPLWAKTLSFSAPSGLTISEIKIFKKSGHRSQNYTEESLQRAFLCPTIQELGSVALPVKQATAQACLQSGEKSLIKGSEVLQSSVLLVHEMLLPLSIHLLISVTWLSTQVSEAKWFLKWSFGWEPKPPKCYS